MIQSVIDPVIEATGTACRPSWRFRRRVRQLKSVRRPVLRRRERPGDQLAVARECRCSAGCERESRDGAEPDERRASSVVREADAVAEAAPSATTSTRRRRPAARSRRAPGARRAASRRPLAPGRRRYRSARAPGRRRCRHDPGPLGFTVSARRSACRTTRASADKLLAARAAADEDPLPGGNGRSPPGDVTSPMVSCWELRREADNGFDRAVASGVTGPQAGVNRLTPLRSAPVQRAAAALAASRSRSRLSSTRSTSRFPAASIPRLDRRSAGACRGARRRIRIPCGRPVPVEESPLTARPGSEPPRDHAQALASRDRVVDSTGSRRKSPVGFGRR